MRRRELLQMGLFGSAVLAASGVGLSLWPTRRLHAPRGPLRIIEEARFAVLAAVAARVVPVAGADPIAIAHAVDDSISRVSPEAGRDFNRLLALLENGLAGLLFDGRPRPFTHLEGAGQDAALHAFRDSRLVLRRSGYHALRKLCASAYYAGESAWPAIGYGGPPTIAPGTSVNPEESAVADALPSDRVAR